MATLPIGYANGKSLQEASTSDTLLLLLQLGRFNTLVPIAALQAIAVFAIWTTSMAIPETLVFAVM